MLSAYCCDAFSIASGNPFSRATFKMLSLYTFKLPSGNVTASPTAEIHAQQRNIIRDFQYNTMVSISPLNEPSLYISANCQNLKYSLKSHRLEMDNSKESEKHKDPWDTLEILYAGMERTAYINPKKLQAEIQRVGTAQTTSGIGKLFGKQGR